MTKLVISGHAAFMKIRVVNIAEAKAHLPELIERAANGETIVLARAGKPRARLVPLEEEGKKKRSPGKKLLGLAPGWERKWAALDERILGLFYEAKK